MQIDQKSTKNQSWTVLGAQGRFGAASGRARDNFWIPKCHPKADLGAPRAGQERPEAVQKRPQGGPERLQELLRPLLKRPQVSFASPNAFGSVCGPIFTGFRSTCRSSEMRFVSLLPMFYRCRTICASNVCRTQKLRKNSCFGLQNRSPGRPGDPRASKFERQNDQVERKSASEVPAGPPKIF